MIKIKFLKYLLNQKTLKEIFNELKIKDSYIIKMDIEGNELFLYEDKTAKNILKKSNYFTMEWHTSNILGYSVNKEMWDNFLIKIFGKTKIAGLGNYECTGAIYHI